MPFEKYLVLSTNLYTVGAITVIFCVSVYAGDCTTVPVCQEHESRERSINPGCLSEDAALHLHHPPWHDQPSSLSRCANTHVGG